MDLKVRMIGLILAVLATSLLIDVSAVAGSVNATGCKQWTVTDFDFAYYGVASPPTYSLEFECTFTAGSALYPVVSSARVAGSCLQGQSSTNCENTALTAANTKCIELCSRSQ